MVCSLQERLEIVLQYRLLHSRVPTCVVACITDMCMHAVAAGVASPGCARHGKAGNATHHRVNDRPSPPKGRVSTVPTGDPACSSGRTPVTWDDYTFFTITRSWAVGRATNTTGNLEFNADACSLSQGSLPNPPDSGDFGLLNYTAYVDCGQFRLEFNNTGVTVTTELDLTLDPAATLDNLDLMSTYSMVFGSPALAKATTCEVEENTMAVQPQVSLITFTGDEPFPLGFDSTSGLLVNQTIGEPSGSVAVNLPFNPARQLGDSFKLRCYTLVRGYSMRRRGWLVLDSVLRLAVHAM